MSRHVLTGLIALTLLVAACGGASGEAAESDRAEELVIGVPTALGTIEGEVSLQAVELAVSEINDAGGVEIDGEEYALRVESTDTRGAEDDIPIPDALSAVERLIADEEPHAILVAPFRSEVILASMDLLAEEQIPTIASIAMTPEYESRIAEEGEDFKYFFRVGLNSQSLAMYISELLGFIGEEHGLESVMFVYQDVLWAEGTANFVQEWAEENGWEVVGSAAFPSGSSDFSSALATARDADADVIVPLFDMPESGALVRQVDSMAIGSLVAGFNSPVAAESSVDGFEPDELEGHVNFIFEIGPLPVESVPRSVEFNEAFGEEYGDEARASLPGHGPGPSYDSVYLLVDAMQRAGSTDPDDIADALAETSDFEGAIGQITFSETNQAVFGTEPGEAALGAAFQWQDGERVPVFPDAIAEGEIQLPDGD